MGLPPKSPIEGGKKVHLFIYGNDAKAKTVLIVPLGFPEYGITNASNIRTAMTSVVENVFLIINSGDHDHESLPVPVARA